MPKYARESIPISGSLDGDVRILGIHSQSSDHHLESKGTMLTEYMLTMVLAHGRCLESGPQPGFSFSHR